MRSYKDLMAALPNEIQELADQKFNNYFRLDPHHEILKGKFIYDGQLGNEAVWSVRISYRYRALARVLSERRGQTMVTVYLWYWAGSREDYENRRA